MAEAPFLSSQSSDYEIHQIPDDQENLGSQKPRKPPTVTPKRFKRFFTPRASHCATNRRQSKAGRRLRDITKNGANLQRGAGAHHNPILYGTEADYTRPLKRRKRSIDITSSPPQSSPLKHVQTVDQIRIFEDRPGSPAFSDEAEDVDSVDDDIQHFAKPIRRLHQSGFSRRILQRTFGGFDALTQGWRGHGHCADWRAETAEFVSIPTDVYRFSGEALPFCTASCNTNSLVAIGEEEGCIKLVDASSSSDFSKVHLSFRPHHNAIMDLAFNSDDYLLATASGDQTARIIDMHTQQTICVLSGHKSSVKQIRFQPNDDNLLTTSSRDGSVLLWDMRCGGKGSVASLRTSFARNVNNGETEPPVRYAKYIMDAGTAHRSTKNTISRTPSNSSTEAAGVSITAIQHLSNGREHLLLTTSELNSSIKLWDLRNVGRRSSTALLSNIPAPSSHSKTRNYGLNAMALSGDGARLYTVCRDGIVYAYSTNHLALDCVPEMSTTVASKARIPKSPRSGLQPLYGFKHPLLRMGTFYVKAAIRRAKDDKSEMLAVGSSDGCAVLLPTDEQYLPERERCAEDGDDEADLPTLASQKSRLASAQGTTFYEHGSALIRGHEKEVTSLTWSHDGGLVTIGDDFTARCWRENGEVARELRGCGEGEGRRWGCGWADMEAAWDQDE